MLGIFQLLGKVLETQGLSA